VTVADGTNGPTRREFDSLERRVKELEEGEKGVIATRLKAVEARVTLQTFSLVGTAISFLALALTIALAASR
jgi:hypothetical protein